MEHIDVRSASASRTAALTLNRRSLIKGLGLGAAGLAVPGVIAGCGTANASTTSIRFEETKPEVIPYFDNLVAAFNKAHPDVSVTHDSTTSLIADFVRGNPPNIDCDNYNLTTSIFVARGVLADLASLPQTKLVEPNVQALVTQYAQFGHEVSVIPYSIAAEGVVYNMELFDKAGVDVPTTWPEFLDVCEKFMSKKITPIYQTFSDTWTTQQGAFDYIAGGSINVAEFYKKLNAEGPNLSADSPVSFQKDLKPACDKIIQLLQYTNSDAATRTYGDGNAAFAAGAGAMYFQGPWAVGEIALVNPKLKVGTFPMPCTDSAADTKCRVNLDLAIWLPRTQAPSKRAAAIKFLDYLMQPSVCNTYNQKNLAFSPLKGAPAQKDPRVAGLNKYVSAGKFYQGPGTYVPTVIPVANFIQEMVLTKNVNGFLAQMDDSFRRLAIRTSA